MLKDIPLCLRLMAFGHSFGDLMVSSSQTTLVRAATYYYVNERGKKMVFLCLEGGTPSATALLVPLPKEGQLINLVSVRNTLKSRLFLSKLADIGKKMLYLHCF